MKRLKVAFAATLAMSFVAAAFVYAQAKPEKGVLVGTVVDLGTYAMQGLGEEHNEAHKARIEEGFPVGVVTDEYAGMKCAIQGLQYKAKGVNVIRVSVLSEY